MPDALGVAKSFHVDVSITKPLITKNKSTPQLPIGSNQPT